jgi:hypothetical protein
VQINLIGNAGSVIEVTATAVTVLAGAWICWRLAPVFAEAIIASPNIHTESIDAHLIRICARLLGIVAGAGLLAMGPTVSGCHCTASSPDWASAGWPSPWRRSRRSRT